MECIFKLPNEVTLPGGSEIILTWKKSSSPHHNKPEYIKFLQDGKCEINYVINWTAAPQWATQPLRVKIYKVTTDFSLNILHSHVTVCINKMVKLNKTFHFEMLKGERICIGVNNYSFTDFTIIDAVLNVRLT